MKARDNPFRTGRVLTVRYRLPDQTWPELLQRLATLNYRAAIVGPEGSGKTTLLEDLAVQLAELGRTTRSLRLNRQQPRLSRDRLIQFFAELNPPDIVLLDGAEQMGPLAWRRFQFRTRHCGGLVITSHHGSLLPTLIHTSTTPELFNDIVSELIPDHALALRATTDALFHQHRGNLRDALRELYDRWSHGTLPMQITPTATSP